MAQVAKYTLNGDFIKLEDAYKKYVSEDSEYPNHIAESDVYKTYELYLALKEKI
jgi:hypothetical protein